MLISTLPPVHHEAALAAQLAHPLVGGARYNVGTRSPYSPRQVLERLQRSEKQSGKLLWVDLKGRQLRVTRWAEPTFADIVLSHAITVDLPATLILRNGDRTQITYIDANRIYVQPNPPSAVGAGQAVNVHGTNLAIHGYLTEEDEEYLAAAKELGIGRFMLSFVEEAEDIQSVRSIIPGAELVLKIESPKGLAFVRDASNETLAGCSLMAARDDLMVNIGDDPFAMLAATRDIVARDPNAICASRIFSGLTQLPSELEPPAADERQQALRAITMGDIADLTLMREYGYRHFMLSDGTSHRHFRGAMAAWEHFTNQFEERS